MTIFSRALRLAALTTILSTAPHLVAPTMSEAESADLIFADQGRDWTYSARNAFYTQDQGAQMIPLKWLRALNQKNGQPFLADSLTRYGYLPNTDLSNKSGLPVGFTSADTPQGPMAGMTCAACHTRQISVNGKALRIDGGPAIVDFESFLRDLDDATRDVLGDPVKFQAFAQAVLDKDVDETSIAVLKADAAVWSVRFHTLMTRALPTDRPWGYSRLDAVSMIFDRLTGLDLGASSTYLIPDNIVLANAPTRYPFLWNASRQDHTQWPGFAPNGNDIFALSRNLGEVYGVFGTFHPRSTIGSVALFNRNYLVDNSANFDGLETLEGLIKRIGPPAWQWGADPQLAARGKKIFDLPSTEDGKGGCAGCHGIHPNFPDFFTWKTPIVPVNTDQSEWKVLTRYAASGTMRGASITGVISPILERDLVITILKASVSGAIAEYEASKLTPHFGISLSPPQFGSALVPNALAPAGTPAAAASVQDLVPSVVSAQTATTPLSQLDATFRLPGLRPQTATTAADDAPPQNGYESRVLQGIWAAAPFLHNGSVPTLADLLKPVDQRPKTFKIGPAYDIVNVGLAVEQPAQSSTLQTTGCDIDGISSGDSNCGHEYGTRLSDDDKKALLEYLKTL